METKILKNEFNLGESGFYYVRMEYANEDVPCHRFDIVQVDEDDYITEIGYTKVLNKIPEEIIYTTFKGLHLSNTETLKTKEQALQRARDLNKARIFTTLADLMEMTSILSENELLDIDDSVGKFLMEINARFNAFEKSKDQTEGEE